MLEFQLNNGNTIPSIGLGTYPMTSKTCQEACKSAKYSGYTLFDTARDYGNEGDVAKGLYGRYFNGLRRKKYVIQTKLSLTDARNHNERKALKKSLKNLKTDYLDMYLLHWAEPNTFLETWKQMEEFYEEGLVKNIGVCNFEIHHLEKLLKVAKIPPVLNQIELHPLLGQGKLIEYCSDKNIHIQAYSPFARMDEKLFNNPRLNDIAQKYNKKVTQIIIRWNIQQGRSVILKSQTPSRLQENIDVFDFSLDSEDIKSINSLDINYRVRFHPDEYPLLF